MSQELEKFLYNIEASYRDEINIDLLLVIIRMQAEALKSIRDFGCDFDILKVIKCDKAIDSLLKGEG